MENDPNANALAAQTQLGGLAISLSGVDTGLELVFLALTGLDHAIGSTVFLSHERTSRRRELVDAVVKIKGQTELTERWNKLRDEHKTLHERRNRLLHDVWALNTQTGEFMTYKQKPPGPLPSGSFKTVDVKELEGLAGRASSLMRDLVILSLDIRKGDEATALPPNPPSP